KQGFDPSRWILRRETAHQVAHRAKNLRARDVVPADQSDYTFHLPLQFIYARVGMLPGVRELLAVEGADYRADVFELEQARARGDEQSYGELDWRDVLDQV